MDPGIDKDESFGSGVLQRRIPYDNKSCYLVNFVYPNNPDKICFWSKEYNRQWTQDFSKTEQYRGFVIRDLYREIQYRLRMNGRADVVYENADVYISLDPKDNQLSISIPIKKGARIGASILESIPEIRVMKGGKTYVATGWADSGNSAYTPLANRNVFADTQINRDGFINATSDVYTGERNFSQMSEDKYNQVNVTIDTSASDYNGPKNFKFGKNGSNTFTIRKGDSLRKYIKEDLPDNGSYKFAYFRKPGDSAHGDTGVGLAYLGYDTPVKDWAKSDRDGSIKIVPVYRNDATSVYVHELPEANSKSVKLATYGDYLPIFDMSGAEGAIPHANVAGKICIGYYTAPGGKAALTKTSLLDDIKNHGKNHLYPVYAEKKRCVIVDYHGGKPAPGSSMSTLKTRFLVDKGERLSDNDFVIPHRDGFYYVGLNKRLYVGTEERHGNGACKWPMWIKYGDGKALDTSTSRGRDHIYDDMVEIGRAHV